MIPLIFEVLKTILWGYIVCLAIHRRKLISVNIFWLVIISSIMMTLGGISDIINPNYLLVKSLWWFVGNLFSIACYYVVLRRSWKFYNVTKRRLTDFIEQIEKDMRDIQDE